MPNIINTSNFLLHKKLDGHGNKGDSLVVELSGEKTGQWHDFATGEGSDVISLWASVFGKDTRTQFPEVISSIHEWLGTPHKPLPQQSTPIPEEDLGSVTGKWDYHDADGNLIACVYRYDQLAFEAISDIVYRAVNAQPSNKQSVHKMRFSYLPYSEDDVTLSAYEIEQMRASAELMERSFAMGEKNRVAVYSALFIAIAIICFVFFDKEKINKFFAQPLSLARLRQSALLKFLKTHRGLYTMLKVVIGIWLSLQMMDWLFPFYYWNWDQMNAIAWGVPEWREWFLQSVSFLGFLTTQKGLYAMLKVLAGVWLFLQIVIP